MSDFNWCHGPECHEKKTQDRVRGTKGNKVLRTRKISLNNYMQNNPNMSWNYLKDVATSYTSYNSYNRSDSARSNISFNSTTGAGQQMRITYDPVGNEDVIIAEKRTTNSGTWTGATETYGTTWATESVSDGIVFGSTFWRKNPYGFGQTHPNPSLFTRAPPAVCPGDRVRLNVHTARCLSR